MTVCNMSIECGARAGMVAPDDTTFAYLEGRPYAPKGNAWSEAVSAWRQLATDDGATFDREITIDGAKLEPIVTWGTNPGMSVPVTASVPNPDDARDASERAAMIAALEYMGLKPGTRIEDITLDRVFIGSCTNGRLEDLRAAAKVIHGHKVHPSVTVLVVPGSEAVKRAAEQRRARPHLQGGGRAVARAGMLDVSGHESRHSRAQAALRFHQQSQLRRPPGPGRTHAPGQSRDRGRRSRGRAFRRCSRLGVQELARWNRFANIVGSSLRCIGRTSIPTRSFPSST